MKPVKLYTTDHCSKCVGAKMLLGRRGITTKKSICHVIRTAVTKLVELTGMFTFPQIVIGDEPIGGL